MKEETISVILSYIFKYLWILCAFILMIEMITTFQTANMMMMKISQDVMMATKHEVENKIDITWKLANALSKDYTLTDESIGMIERGRLLKPYTGVYNLFLIGITDKNGQITSSYDDIPGNISHREYFQRVMKTGKAEITDVFLAGADSKTKNYTICVPIFDQKGHTNGTIIMSIYYRDIHQIIMRSLHESSYRFSIMDSRNIVMSEKDESLIGKRFLQVEDHSIFIGNDKKRVNKDILNKKSGSYWCFYQGKLQYVQYAPIKNTNWSFNVQTDVLSIAKPILLQSLCKALLYIGIFIFLSFWCQRYMKNKLKSINTLVQQVSSLQYELQQQHILNSDEITEFIQISQEGLFDALTGLPTRYVFLRKQKIAFESAQGMQYIALIILDLDHLKQINDDFGHQMGDLALKHIGCCVSEVCDLQNGFGCRYGGDEFMIYMPFQNENELVKILMTVMDKITTEIEFEGMRTTVNVSIGVAIYPQHGDSFEKLYSCADMALYQAKQNGRKRYEIYKQS